MSVHHELELVVSNICLRRWSSFQAICRCNNEYEYNVSVCYSDTLVNISELKELTCSMFDHINDNWRPIHLQRQTLTTTSTYLVHEHNYQASNLYLFSPNWVITHTS